MSNPWNVNDISFQQLKVILTDEAKYGDCFHKTQQHSPDIMPDIMPEWSTECLIKKLQEADRKVLEIREIAYRTKIAIDYTEIVTANIAVTQLAQTLDKLVSDLQTINKGDSLQQAFENLLYQVGLIKCDMTSESRSKTLQAIRCAVQSTRQLLLQDKQKARSKLSDELDAISESISMFDSDSELSVDDIMDVMAALTAALQRANQTMTTDAARC